MGRVADVVLVVFLEGAAGWGLVERLVRARRTLHWIARGWASQRRVIGVVLQDLPTWLGPVNARGRATQPIDRARATGRGRTVVMVSCWSLDVIGPPLWASGDLPWGSPVAFYLSTCIPTTVGPPCTRWMLLATPGAISIPTSPM